MVEQKLCQECNQSHDCQRIYQKLGNIKSPSVTFKVLVAFLLPIAVFIISLTVFSRILDELIKAKELQTALSFLLALPVTLALILAIKVINR